LQKYEIIYEPIHITFKNYKDDYTKKSSDYKDCNLEEYIKYIFSKISDINNRNEKIKEIEKELNIFLNILVKLKYLCYNLEFNNFRIYYLETENKPYVINIYLHNLNLNNYFEKSQIKIDKTKILHQETIYTLLYYYKLSLYIKYKSILNKFYLGKDTNYYLLFSNFLTNDFLGFIFFQEKIINYNNNIITNPNLDFNTTVMNSINKLLIVSDNKTIYNKLKKKIKE